MRVVMVVPFNAGGSTAQSSAMEVANTFSAAGWIVRLVQGDDASRAGLGRAIGGAGYDLVWLWAHSDKLGFKLSDDVITPTELGQFISMTGAADVVLNACFSIEHVETLQRGANVNVVATINPDGISASAAWSTAVYLAKALTDTGDLRSAYNIASANGLAQYRYIPSSGLKMSSPNKNDDLWDTVQQLVVAIQGNAFTRTPGMLDEVRGIATKLDSYMREDAAWKSRFEDRLTTLEARRPAEMSWRTMLFALLLVLASSAVVLLVIGRLSSGGA